MNRSTAHAAGAGGLLRDIAAIVLVGALLGVVYNLVGNRAQPAFGIAWIGTDPAADVFVLEDGAEVDGPEAAADGAAPTMMTDDPLAIMMTAEPATPDLPEIPALDRPIQIQVPVVKKFFDADGALIIDARDPDEFREGHLPGAINLPFDSAVTDPALLQSLPVEGRPIIVYCGGGTCEVSITLAWELLGVGHSRVTYFPGGYPEWVENGYPVETGDREGV